MKDFNIKCRECKHNYKPFGCEPKCNHMCDENHSDFEPATNYDLIMKMDEERLADFLSGLLNDRCLGSLCENQPKNEYGVANCYQCRLNWLRSVT